MGWRNTSLKYGGFSQAMHWLVVAGIIASYFTAEVFDSDSEAVMALHRSLGITIFFLAVVRIAWLLFDPPPGVPASMARWQKVAARSAHTVLYVLLFALPLTGWLLSSAEGDPVVLFGSLTIPPLPTSAGPDKIEDIHEVLFNVLAAVAALHAAAALKHHFLDRDGVLKRMLPGQVGPN
jgi:cytochrome b561